MEGQEKCCNMDSSSLASCVAENWFVAGFDEVDTGQGG